MNDPKRILIILLAFITVVIGALGVKGLAEDSGYKKQVLYTTAIKAEDSNRFNYAVDSQQGNLLVNGVFKTDTKNLVKFDEMTKAYTYVERTKEHYTMHTYTTCSGGKVRTCTTHTYYSWDSIGSEERKAPQVSFDGRNYNGDLFNFHNFLQSASCNGMTNENTQHDFFSNKHGCDGDEYYLDDNDRYVYATVPDSLKATFIANSLQGGLKPINEDRITLENKSIDQVMHDVGMYKVYAFWTTLVIIFFIFIGACIGTYYWVMADGRWSWYD